MPTTSLQAKFKQAIQEMSAYLVERNEEVALMMTGLVAGENLLLCGAPGTAKSMLSRLVARFLSCKRGDYFEYQLTRFTELDELFGPVDLMNLKTTGNYTRRTKYKLPTAVVAFIDEYWNTSSAVANSLHLLMNERRFDDGNGLAAVPLRFVIAASNIWPSAATGHDNCEAAFDRFLLRRKVKTVQTKDGRSRILWDPALRKPLTLSVTVTVQELDQARQEAEAMEWLPESKQVFEQILDAVQNEAMQTPVDRRLAKCAGAVQAYAYTQGAEKVRPEHLEVLKDVLWMVPEAADKVAQIVVKLANPVRCMVEDLLVEVAQLEASVDWSTDEKVFVSGKSALASIKEVVLKLQGMRSSPVANDAFKYAKAKLYALDGKVNARVSSKTVVKF